MISARTLDQMEALVLSSAAAGGVEVTFVPAAGMIGCSLRHRGDELLGQRRGLRAYVEEQATMGIPLLYPWANRLGAERFAVAGREVVLDAPTTPMRRDAQGLPMHGLLAAARDWRLQRHEAAGDGGILSASLDFGADERRLAAFPFPHSLSLEATLAGPTLTIATTVTASAGVPVPIAFGFHPYLALPGVERSEWWVDVPVRERLLLDGRMLPTGAREATAVESGRLGSRTFDDAYAAPRNGAPFVVQGGGRRVELSFLDGFPYAQVFAPAEDDVIAFEPMTAPTNALVDGGSDLVVLTPGDSYRAVFSITVANAA